MAKDNAKRTRSFRFKHHIFENDVVEKLSSRPKWFLWLGNEEGDRARNIQLYASDPSGQLYTVTTRLMAPRVFNAINGIEGWLARRMPDTKFYNIPTETLPSGALVPFPAGHKIRYANDKTGHLSDDTV